MKALSAILLFVLTLSSVNSLKAQSWSEINKIVAADRAAEDNFAYSVAINDSIAVVGAPGEDEDAAGGSFVDKAGAAYVFRLDAGGNWVEVQKLVASDRQFEDGFGHAVAVSGNYIMVSAFAQDLDTAGLNFMDNAGAVYVFESSGGSWLETQKLIASDRAMNDQFGYDIGLDGNTVVVGAFGEDEDPFGGNTLGLAGSAYIFRRDASGIWNELTKIVASDRDLDDRFGLSVDISGNRVIVGAHREDEDPSGADFLNNSGAAYIFEEITGTWTQVEKIVAPDRGSDDNYGYDVAIDGNTALVGAELEDHDADGTNYLDRAGSAYIYRRNSGGAWLFYQKIVAPDRAWTDRFARSVDISGGNILIGAYWEDEDAAGLNTLNSAGSAYLFVEDSTGSWVHDSKLAASDRNTLDWLGHSVAVSGPYGIVGAYLESEDALGGSTATSSGSAYIFQGPANSCTPNDTTFAASACVDYLSPSGTYVWSSNGIYFDTLLNAGGCDSVLEIDLSITTIDNSVVVFINSLTANQTGASYQWIDCSDSSSISGANAMTFAPNGSGDYAVVLNVAGCIDTSACYTIQVVGIEKPTYSVSVYPTLLKGNTLYIDPGTTAPYFVSITNLYGQEIYRYSGRGREVISPEIETGFYHLSLIIDHQIMWSGPIVKQ